MLTKIFKHPLIDHKLTIMRKSETNSKDFKDNLDEITKLMVFTITDDLKTKTVDIATPVTSTTGNILDQDVIIVPILRAGLGMIEGVRELIPTAKVAHVGMFRNEETLKPQKYYSKFPKQISKNAMVLILDPMLATGGTAVEAINLVKEEGFNNIKLICLVGVEYGIKTVETAHPEVEIYLAAKDKELLSNGYISPGLGDAGDRIFGTK